jgi:hypothetical protein
MSKVCCATCAKPKRPLEYRWGVGWVCQTCKRKQKR